MSEQMRRYGIDRRAFLGGALAALALPLLPARARAASLDAATVRALETSPLVYLSPLRRDGSESACHAEIWFAWLDGAVVVITSAKGWRARALAKGFERARIWVGDHGRWKGAVTNNEAFREAPSFTARASRVDDGKLLDRLIAAYETKYPAEIGRWRDRFRDGFRSGDRVLLRYAIEGTDQVRGRTSGTNRYEDAAAVGPEVRPLVSL